MMKENTYSLFMAFFSVLIFLYLLILPLIIILINIENSICNRYKIRKFEEVNN